MKIALLSDIHGNAGALEAVLAQMPTDIGELWVLGDLTGYYYQTKVVLNLLKKYTTKIITGNHEILLRQAHESKELAERYLHKYGSSLKIALETLSPDELDYLIKLPTTLTISLKGAEVILCHGTPWFYDDYIYPDAPLETLERFLSFKEQIFFLGHTHYPMDISYKGKRIINPGSVGQPRNRKPGAQWAIFDTESFEIHFQNTPYDVAALIKQVEQIDPLNNYLKMVLTRS